MIIIMLIIIVIQSSTEGDNKGMVVGRVIKNGPCVMLGSDVLLIPPQLVQNALINILIPNHVSL